jgi:hypothetical protein
MFMRDIGLKEKSVRAAYRDPGECVSRLYPLFHMLAFDNLFAFLTRHSIKWNKRPSFFEVNLKLRSLQQVKAKQNNSNQAVHDGEFGLGKASLDLDA